ncbi:MAG: serine hydrolase [Gemmatimonadetes bacterium]|nr:serine hydrolase [Gemmatimonadota bacterium]NNL29521.1 serine hydrolase [Gemmatimonadota bacterium]
MTRPERRHGRNVHPAVWALLLLAGGCTDAPLGPTTTTPVELSAPWETAAAVEVGLDPFALQLAGARAASVDRMRSLLVVRHGRLVYEGYFNGADRETLADVRSVTKSVVGALVGLAIDAGHIESTEQSIADFLSGPHAPLRPEHAEVTVGHLLSMASGIQWTESGSVGYLDWIAAPDHVAYLLERTFVATPGETFAYNSAAIHLLGVIVEEAAGRTLPAFADEVLFGPLGIVDRTWEPIGSGGHVNGGAGLDLRPRDLARFGQLYLQGGESGRRRILPEEWVRNSMGPIMGALGSVTAIGPVSYGYLWWIDESRGAVFAWGYGGQLVYVHPGLDLVVVTTTEWRGVSQDEGNAWLTEQSMRLVVEGVLPAVR